MSLKQTNKIDTNRYQLEITIDADKFSEAISLAYKKNGRKINVPGFRKGKAPLSIIEKYYGTDIFFEDALNLIYSDAVEGAIKESELNVIDDKMDFDLVSISKEDGVEFKVSLTTYPEIEIGEYKGLKAEKVAVKVEDAEIESEINAMADRNSRMISVEDRAAENGDTAVIDFEGFVDGVAFDGGKAEAHSLVLGSGQFIPGFEEQVIGKNINDEFDVIVTFPEDYGSADLAGKEATFKIKLHELKIKELPNIDDEFAKDVSDFDNIDALKADITAKALERKTKASDEAVENALVEQIVDSITGEIPEAMFESRLEQSVQDFAYRLQTQGMNIETYLQYTNSTMDDFKASFRPQAEKQVKFRLALEKIASLENITADDEAVEAEYAKMAENYSVDIERVKSSVPAKELAKDLAVGKAIDFIKENAKIIEVVAEADAPVKKPAAKKAAAEKKTTDEKKPAAKKAATGEKKAPAKKTAAKKAEDTKAAE